MRSDGVFLREYDLIGDSQEGIALVPACGLGEATVFVAEDAGEVWRYLDYPTPCVPKPIPTMPQWALAILIVAIWQVGATLSSSEAR